MVLSGQFPVILKLVLILVNVYLLQVGASSSHSGIDIPAPQGTKFIAVADGEITFCQSAHSYNFWKEEFKKGIRSHSKYL